MLVLGAFASGPGRYSVDLVLYDPGGAVCQAHHTQEGRLPPKLADLKLSLTEGQVLDLSTPPWTLSQQRTPGGKGGRLTILMHALPAPWRNAPRISVQARDVLLGTVASILRQPLLTFPCGRFQPRSAG
jgi:hypothetical protein